MVSWPAPACAGCGGHASRVAMKSTSSSADLSTRWHGTTAAKMRGFTGIWALERVLTEKVAFRLTSATDLTAANPSCWDGRTGDYPEARACGHHHKSPWEES